jgi:hypothetical protein
MKLRETILAEHSRSQADKIIEWVGNSQQRFDELFGLFLRDEDLVKQRAAWPLSHIAISHPELIVKHFGKLIKNLQKKELHDAVKRNTMKILDNIEIPKPYHGQVMNTCFEYVQSPREAAAIKAFSLGILEKLLPLYPDISQELKLIIEEQMDQEKPAFRSRAKKILKKLSR